MADHGGAPSAPERRAERGGVIDASRARAYRQALEREAAEDQGAAGAQGRSTPAEIWASLPLEEQRRRARARGMRISDMEADLSMNSAIAASTERSRTSYGLSERIKAGLATVEQEAASARTASVEAESGNAAAETTEEVTEVLYQAAMDTPGMRARGGHAAFGIGTTVENVGDEDDDEVGDVVARPTEDWLAYRVADGKAAAAVSLLPALPDEEVVSGGGDGGGDDGGGEEARAKVSRQERFPKYGLASVGEDGEDMEDGERLLEQKQDGKAGARSVGEGRGEKEISEGAAQAAADTQAYAVARALGERGDHGRKGGGRAGGKKGKKAGSQGKGVAAGKSDDDEVNAEEEEGGAGQDKEEEEQSPVVDFPKDLLHRISQFLNLDEVGTLLCAHVSMRDMGDETLFQILCQRTYMVQSQRKTLSPSKWGGWRAMLLRRPRVRTNGMYCLKNTRVKEVVRDMWSDPVPAHMMVINSSYYRYFRFFNDGTCLYALTHHPPEKMLKYLHFDAQASATSAPEPFKRRRKGRKDTDKLTQEIHLGSYTIRRNDVQISIDTPFSVVSFEAEIRHGRRGHFCMLEIKDHVSHSKTWNPRTEQRELLPGGCLTHHSETLGYEFHFRRVPLIHRPVWA